LKIVYTLISFALLASCAGWRLESTDRVGEYPADVKVNEKIKIKINFQAYDVFYNDELKESSLSDTKKVEMMQAIKQAYLDTNIFLLDEKNPDVQANIKIKSEGKGNGNRALLSYFTLFLVPSSSQTTYTVTTEFLDRDNELLGSIRRSDTVVKWQQLFMLFAMPFKYPYKAMRETLIDLNRSTLVEAFREGYFREVKL
jgi:hypothetical protein